MDPQIKMLLKELERKCRLFLLTEGNANFQNSKIDCLGIRQYFAKIVMASASKNNKRQQIASLMDEHKLEKDSTLIIGNRLDKEIIAGNQLGIKTVWIRHGEGCEMVNSSKNGIPDYTFSSILEIRDALGKKLPI
jgi:putative hydrolase of the HAD superfamily